MSALGRKRTLDAKPFETVRQLLSGEINLKNTSARWHRSRFRSVKNGRCIQPYVSSPCGAGSRPTTTYNVINISNRNTAKRVRARCYQ